MRPPLMHATPESRHWSHRGGYEVPTLQPFHDTPQWLLPILEVEVGYRPMQLRVLDKGRGGWIAGGLAVHPPTRLSSLITLKTPYAVEAAETC